MAQVKTDAVPGQQPLHGVAQRCRAAPHHEVKMIVHQDVRQQRQVLGNRHAYEPLEKVGAIRRIAKDPAPFHSSSEARDRLADV